MMLPKKLLILALATFGFAAPAGVIAQQDEPRPAPNNQDKPGKPDQVPTGQVVIGKIRQVNPKQRTVVVIVVDDPKTQIQYQKPRKGKDSKASDSEELVVYVTDDTVIQVPDDAKGVDDNSGKGVKPEPNPNQKQDPKQDPKDKPHGPGPGQFGQLQAGQTVQVVQQQHDGKCRAVRIRVLQVQQAD